MADLSAGKDDKVVVSRTYNIGESLARTPRTPSRGKSSRNLFDKIFGGDKKLDVFDDDKLSSSSRIEPQEKVMTFSDVRDKVEGGLTKAIHKIFHPGKDSKEKKTNANPVVESKEPTPAPDKASEIYISNVTNVVNIAHVHQHELVVAEASKKPETDEARSKEDNSIVVSLGEGLQKICGLLNTKKEDKPKEQENNQKDNFIVFLAEGLQKICRPNKKED